MKNQRQRICQHCVFQTERLLAMEWHSFSAESVYSRDLPGVVANMLTEPVTRLLPNSWLGDYSIERARTWIRERDEEGTTLLVLDQHSKQAIGLMILFEAESPISENRIEVRVGYILSESAWGKGFASEMLRGLVDWCRGQAAISSLAGGVDRANGASRRALEKNGFRIAQQGGEDELYRLTFRR